MWDKMLEEAKAARARAYCPYSKFRVGSCLMTPEGELFSGCNVENASYSITVCAETSAVAAMVNAGRSRISKLLLIGSADGLCAPCGACRQCINEFALPDTEVCLCAEKESGEVLQEVVLLKELLPRSFGRETMTDLGQVTEV